MRVRLPDRHPVHKALNLVYRAMERHHISFAFDTDGTIFVHHRGKRYELREIEHTSALTWGPYELPPEIECVIYKKD